MPPLVSGDEPPGARDIMAHLAFPKLYVLRALLRDRCRAPSLVPPHISGDKAPGARDVMGEDDRQRDVPAGGGVRPEGRILERLRRRLCAQEALRRAAEGERRARREVRRALYYLSTAASPTSTTDLEFTVFLCMIPVLRTGISL